MVGAYATGLTAPDRAGGASAASGSLVQILDEVANFVTAFSLS
jgi:hypothetical protein